MNIFEVNGDNFFIIPEWINKCASQESIFPFSRRACPACLIGAAISLDALINPVPYHT
jgi:hypothetical protein